MGVSKGFVAEVANAAQRENKIAKNVESNGGTSCHIMFIFALQGINQRINQMHSVVLFCYTSTPSSFASFSSDVGRRPSRTSHKHASIHFLLLRLTGKVRRVTPSGGHVLWLRDVQAGGAQGLTIVKHKKERSKVIHVKVKGKGVKLCTDVKKQRAGELLRWGLATVSDTHFFCGRYYT